MPVINLLFLPFGRMKRLHYALMTGLFGALNVGLVLLMVLQNGGNMGEIVVAGPLALMRSSHLMAAFTLVCMWIQMCFVFKRSRDFSGNAFCAWVFLGLWAVPVLWPVLGPNGNSTTYGTLQLICGIPAAVMGFVLLLKGSCAEAVQPVELGTEDVDFGLGELNETTDLVARAQVLRTLDAPKGQATVQVGSKSGIAAQPGFGRRKAAALSGN